MADLLHVDMTHGTMTTRALAAEQELLGGRGLTSAIVADEVDPKTDPVGPDNILVFACGVLAGTAVPNAGRLSAGAKSPLTGGIKESNSGGAVARKLARLGLRGIEVTGRADALCVLVLTARASELVPADELRGLTTRETIRVLRERYGDKVAIVCVGPAGELQLKAASIMVTTPDFRLRAAARGGLGAVMGSKNLKAVVVDDSGGPGVKAADPAALKAAASALSKGIKSHPAMGALGALGSAFLVSLTNTLGCMPTRNFTEGHSESAEAVSGEHMFEVMNSRPNSDSHHSCMVGCIVHCSQVYTDENGAEITSGLEYETLALLGPNCGIFDLDQIARIDRLCDDLGLDTMEIGNAVGVAMEGGLLPWGDGAAVHELLSRMVAGDESARLITSGCVATGAALGVSRVPAVKGQGLAGYDPRVLKGTGVTYATTAQGGDHTCGNCLPSPTLPDYDPSSAQGQAEMSQFVQPFFAGIDGLGMCLFACLPLLDIPELPGQLVAAVAAMAGRELPEDYLWRYGTQIVLQERDFNRRAGFTAADDRLPAFMVTEALPPTGNRFDVSDADLDGMFLA